MKKLLIVVDYQKDFVDGALGFPAAKEIEEALCEKIRSYQAEGQDIICTLDTHGEDYLETQEGKNLPIPHCIKGSEGHQLYGKAAGLLSSCPQFEKPAFGSMALAKWLEDKEYEEIELCGVVTDICVISNAVLCKAALPETQVTVDSACVAAITEEAQQAAFSVMKSLQIKVL